jgi:hypothetical protein
MAIPPPRKPLPQREPEPEPEYDDNDPAARRRRLREEALRGRKQVNMALNMPPPAEGGGLPPMPAKKGGWLKYLLIFPLVLAVVGLMMFTLMVDPSDLQNRDKVKLSAILGFSDLAPPPEGAKNIVSMDPSDTINKKYALRFEAPPPAIEAWVASSKSLQGVEPVKVGTSEIYKVEPQAEQTHLRRTEVKIDKYASFVEVAVDGFKAPVAETNMAYAERRRREEKEKAAKAAAASGLPTPDVGKIPASAGSSPFPPVSSSAASAAPAAPVAPKNAADAQRLANEAEVLRILSKGGAGSIRLQNPPTGAAGQGGDAPAKPAQQPSAPARQN